MKRDPLIQEFAERLWAVHGPEALYEGLEEFKARVLQMYPLLVAVLPTQELKVGDTFNIKRHDLDTAVDVALKLQSLPDE